MGKKDRKELPAVRIEETWNLQDIYQDDAAWEKDFSVVQEAIAALSEYEGKLGQGAETFFAFLEKMHKVELSLNRLALYANLLHSRDTTVAKYLEYSLKVEWLHGRFQESTAFFLPEYKALSTEQVFEFLSQVPRYGYYERYLKELERKRPHILSHEEEALLAQSSEALQAVQNVFTLLTNADLTFPKIHGEKGKVELTEANYSSFIRSHQRKVRKEAFFGLFDTYGKFKNTISQTLNGSVKADYFSARARKFPSSLAASLFDDNLTPEFYDLVLEKIGEGLPENHRYISVKKKCLGYDELQPYDLYVSPLKHEANEEFSYEECKKIVLEGLSPLGEEYIKVLREGLDGRWVDVWPQHGKVKGAFSASVWDVHPYVLLNYVGNFNEVLTLAHEMGHALHSYFSNKAQPFIYSEYSIIAAEVASITNELLVIACLLEKETKKEKRLGLINHFLEGFRTTVFRQAMFAEFEREIHRRVGEGNALTAEWLNALWKDLNSKYYGPDLAYEPALDVEWARIPHFYTSFYVYKYVLGFVTGVVVSQGIHKGEAGAVERYMEFLQSGSTADPLELLERLGVRIKRGEAITEAINVFRDYLNQFAAEF